MNTRRLVVDEAISRDQTNGSNEGFATVDVLYNGPLGVFKARSLSEAS